MCIVYVIKNTNQNPKIEIAPTWKRVPVVMKTIDEKRTPTAKVYML